MHRFQRDEHSHFKLAQLWNLVKDPFQKTGLRKVLISEILNSDFDINYKITINLNSDPDSAIHLKNCTALHFSSYKRLDIETFVTLIERGADFTIKNGNGQTALHLIITSYAITTESQFDNTVLCRHVLSHQVKIKNFVNPRDDNGLSHFHIACIIDYVEAVELFLNNGTSVDEVVNFDAPQFAGYTALHFATAFNSMKVIQILVKLGANCNAQTAEGKYPLDLLIIRKESSLPEKISEYKDVIKILLNKGAVCSIGLSNLQIAFMLKDLSVAERLINEVTDIDYAVPMNALLYPGDTALHFAALNSIKAVKMLVEKGASINIFNAERMTVIDVIMNRYNLEDRYDILMCLENRNKKPFLFGQKNLLDLIPTITNLEQFELFLQNEIKDVNAIVPSDSELWPGYSILHLAVALAGIEYNEHLRLSHDTTIIEHCLNEGLNMNTKNVHGETPIHLAFRLGKKEIIELLLEYLNEQEHIDNLVDDNNLSYLHIACAMKDKTLVAKLLKVLNQNDVNRRTNSKTIVFRYSIGAGATPLHVAVANDDYIIAAMLLSHGANLHLIDAKGMAPIHWFVTKLPLEQRIFDILFSALLNNPKDVVVDGIGLSYLHIACKLGRLDVIEKLLDFGSNVNATIRCDKQASNLVTDDALRFINLYSNYTPLEIVAKSFGSQEDLINVLLRRGANIFLKGSDETEYSQFIPAKNRNVLRCYFRILWERDDMQKCMEEKIGLTRLHIACYLKNEEAIRNEVEEGIINAQISMNSELFPGCTALHLLMTKTNLYEQLIIGDMVTLLLERGADVTIANAEKDTPIHLLDKHSRTFDDADTWQYLLVDAHKDYSINPVDAQGVSHFHLMCLWNDFESINNFLQHGSIDINQPINFFASVSTPAGSTPLHLILMHRIEDDDGLTRLLEIVVSLLEYGAEVAAKDVNGDTPLHKRAVLLSPKLSLLEKLVEYGGDTTTENMQGQSPIQELVNMYSIDDENSLSDSLTLFKKFGYKINSWNRLTKEGYIAKIFLSSSEGNLSESLEFKKFLESPDARTIDSMGRTAIHNAVTISPKNHTEEIENYVYALKSFKEMDIDIDHQDTSGQTALHYGIEKENITGVKALLACGADINIIDNLEKSAFSYVMEHQDGTYILNIFGTPNIMTVLGLHVQKLQHLKIEVSQLNQNLLIELQTIYDNPIIHLLPDKPIDLSESFFNQLEEAKTHDIGFNSLILYDFLSETGAVTLYPLLLKSERDVVDKFFKSNAFQKYDELVDIINLQHQKMRKKINMIDLAFNSLRKLLGFSVPGLCEQISRFLSNTDLENLIQATKLRVRKRKISEISC